MTRFAEISAFILAGGESRRMGRDKALLGLAGQTLLERTAALLAPLVASVTVLGPPGKFMRFGLPVLPDEVEGKGPLAGLVTGLRAATTEWSLFVACDLPYLDSRFVEFLLAESREAAQEAIVPETAEGPQPLCALYRRSCLGVMARALASGNPAIVNCLPALRVRWLRAEHLKDFAFPEELFKNINTPEDYECARQALEGKR